jgi:Protein of unknown function (DUF2971)
VLLYKYCRPEGIEALRSGKNFLSRPRAFNDPFEMSPHISRFENPAEMDAYVWERTKHFVVLSLAENRESLLMWAHYTERHRGFLIAFDDADGGILSVYSQHRDFGPVSYCHHRPSHSKMKAVTNQELFYWKNSEWAYEREWRIIDSLHSADGEATDLSRDCWPFKFRPEAVREVILGHRSGAIISDICQILREPRYEHVRLLIASPDPKRFHLNFAEIQRGQWPPNIPEEDRDPD